LDEADFLGAEGGAAEGEFEGFGAAEEDGERHDGAEGHDGEADVEGFDGVAGDGTPGAFGEILEVSGGVAEEGGAGEEDEGGGGEDEAAAAVGAADGAPVGEEAGEVFGGAADVGEFHFEEGAVEGGGVGVGLEEAAGAAFGEGVGGFLVAAFGEGDDVVAEEAEDFRGLAEIAGVHGDAELDAALGEFEGVFPGGVEAGEEAVGGGVGDGGLDVAEDAAGEDLVELALGGVGGIADGDAADVVEEDGEGEGVDDFVPALGGFAAVAEGADGVEEAGLDGEGMLAAVEEGEALAGGSEGVVEFLVGGKREGEEEMSLGIGGEKFDGAAGLGGGFGGEAFGEEGGGVLLLFHATGGFGGAEDLADIFEVAFDGIEDGDGLFLELLEIFEAGDDGGVAFTSIGLFGEFEFGVVEGGEGAVGGVANIEEDGFGEQVGGGGARGSREGIVGGGLLVIGKGWLTGGLAHDCILRDAEFGDASHCVPHPCVGDTIPKCGEGGNTVVGGCGEWGAGSGGGGEAGVTRRGKVEAQWGARWERKVEAQWGARWEGGGKENG
jgi:hypothetical protein